MNLRWWAEWQDGVLVHLTLVDVLEEMPAPHHFRVRSVRSGNYYGAAEHDLLPLATALDPRERCARCGRERGDHNVRHKFADRSEWPEDCRGT